MKKILSVIVAVVMLAATFSLAVFADDHPLPAFEVSSAVKFYDKDGNEVQVGGENSPWGLFTYWKGYKSSQIYDYSAGLSGNGGYVEGEVYGDSFFFVVGNGGENNNVDLQVYVDGVLKQTFNAKESGQNTKFEVTGAGEGKHTVKIVTANADGWASFAFNCLVYNINKEVKLVPTAELKFYNAADGEETPGGEGAAWSVFPWWTVGGIQINEINGGVADNGNGTYAKAHVECDGFFVLFGNGNGDCKSEIEVYCDGAKVMDTSAFVDGGENATFYIPVANGEHDLMIKKVGGEGWQAMPFATFGYTEHTESPATADLTGVIAVIGVVALAGTALIVKKH